MADIDVKVCDDCFFGTEAGGCEGRGAKWDGKEWMPTQDCVPDPLMDGE